MEIGYWVDEAQQGRGIATRVSAALMEFAFAHPEVERVLIKHKLGNAKSGRVPEKLGFALIPGDQTCGEDPGLAWEYTRAMWEQRGTA